MKMPAKTEFRIPPANVETGWKTIVLNFCLAYNRLQTFSQRAVVKVDVEVFHKFQKKCHARLREIRVLLRKNIVSRKDNIIFI